MIGAPRPAASRHKELDALVRISRLLDGPDSWTRQVPELLAEISGIVGADASALLMLDEDTNALSVVGDTGAPEATQGASAAVPSDIALRSFSEQSIVTDNVPSRSWGSIAALPVRHGPEVVGVIEARAATARFFTPNKVSTLAAVADSIGMLVHNTKLKAAITLEQARNRRKDQFISIASHEIRSPMAALLGFTELLMLREPGPEERMEWYKVINQEAERLTRVTSELLDVSSIEVGALSFDLQPLALEPLILSMLPAINLTSKLHQVLMSSGATVPNVSADPEKVSHIVRNLVDNAIKYSPEGGPVTISFVHNRKAGRVVTSVTDNGIGIGRPEIKRLFEIFQRANQPEAADIRGTGLGLYIVKSYVELMYGSVSVRSRRHVGSTFSFSLPVSLERPPADKAQSRIRRVK